MKLVATILILFIQITIWGQLNTTDFEQIDSLNKDGRNIIVFIHTDWCKYCSKMKNTTFKNSEVISTINSSFIYCSLNGESKQDIKFNGHTFKYIPTGNNVGQHELAKALGTIDGELNFPTICILNSKYEIIFQYSSYFNSKQFLKVLQASLK